VIVIPANAGIQKILMPQADPPVAEILDSRFHGNDTMEKSCQENKKLPDNSSTIALLMKYVG